MSEKNGNNGNGDLRGGLSGENPLSLLRAAAEKVSKPKKPPKLELPPTNRPDVSDLELLEIQIQEAIDHDTRVAEEVGQWMEGTSLPYIDKIHAMVARLGDTVLKMFTSEVDDKGNRLTHGQLLKDYTQRNISYLCAEIRVGDEMENGEFMTTPALRTRKAAHMAVLKHRFSSETDSWDQLNELISKSVEDGYLEEDPNGLIELGRCKYRFSNSEKFGGLGRQEEQLMSEIVGLHKRHLNEAYYEDTQERAGELAKQAEISFAELMDSKEGRCFVHVPADPKYKQRRVFLLLEGVKEGNRFWIRLLNAVGPDEDRALDIYNNSKLKLNLAHMDVPSPPRIETMMEGWGFSEANAKRYQLFWNYIKRAKRALEEQAQKEAIVFAKREREILSAKAKQEEAEFWNNALSEAGTLKEEYCHEATVSLDRVLLEETPMEGVFFAEFERDWENPRGNVPKGLLFFLGELRFFEGKPHIRVKTAPDHLKGRFFSEESLEFAPCGNIFRGLSQPLQGLMKALYHQEKNRVMS